MAAYYSNLNNSTLTDTIRQAGNSAHQIRNYMAGRGGAKYPELMIVDNLSAQIEATTRDIMSCIHHKYDIHPSLTNCIRCIKLGQRTLCTDIPNYIYESINESEFSIVINYLNICDELLSTVAAMIVESATLQFNKDFHLSMKIINDQSRINRATLNNNNNNINDSDTVIVSNINNDNSNNIYEMKSDELINNNNNSIFDSNSNINNSSHAILIDRNNLDIDFSNGKYLFDLESFVLKEPCHYNEFANNVIAMAMYGCNMSHEIQNHASIYIRINPGKDIANMLIKEAGSMENQFRAIQAQSRQFIKNIKNNANIDGQKQNYVKNLNKHLDVSIKNLENIGKRGECNHLDLSKVDGIDGTLQILVATLRENMKLQFGL